MQKENKESVTRYENEVAEANTKLEEFFVSNSKAVDAFVDIVHIAIEIKVWWKATIQIIMIIIHYNFYIGAGIPLARIVQILHCYFWPNTGISTFHNW